MRCAGTRCAGDALCRDALVCAGQEASLKRAEALVLRPSNALQARSAR